MNQAPFMNNLMNACPPPVVFSFTNNSRISDLARRKKDSNSINPRSNGMVDISKQVRGATFYTLLDLMSKRLFSLRVTVLQA